MIFHEHLRQTRVSAHHFAFSVTNRQVEPTQPPSEDAIRFPVYYQGNPTILKPTAVVARDCHFPPSVVTISGRKHSELGEELKPIADTQDEAPVIDESDHPINESLSAYLRMPDTVRACLSCPQVITIQETTGKNDDPIRCGIYFARGQDVEVHQINIVKPRCLQCMSCFHLAVDAVTGGNQGSEFHCDSRAG